MNKIKRNNKRKQSYRRCKDRKYWIKKKEKWKRRRRRRNSRKWK